MKEYAREYPFFSLCGLNCGLCPRHQAEGDSRCPGCGGPEFVEKHPSCAVISCARKHGGVEYCFQCPDYPCPKYQTPSPLDSFITYRNVLSDFRKAGEEGLELYRAELDEKMRFLETLIREYNDGKRKNFYCVAVNLLPVEDIREISDEIRREIQPGNAQLREKIGQVVSLFEKKARDRQMELALRKKAPGKRNRKAD